jgi:hypothetical protein
MYAVEAMLGLMFLFWCAAIWASFTHRETPI